MLLRNWRNKVDAIQHWRKYLPVTECRREKGMGDENQLESREQ